MLSETLKNWVFKMDNQYNLGLCEAMGIHVEYDIDADIAQNKDYQPEQLHSPFRLPITYLPENEIRPLSKIVKSDLELDDSPTTMYEYLLKPKHQFARNLISDWNQHFTTYTPFLEDSQRMIYNMAHYLERMTSPFYAPGDLPLADSGEEAVEAGQSPDESKCDKIVNIWLDIKEDPLFLEKYGYIEWEWFKHLNQSSVFLQSLSIVNMSSPIMSFIIPIVFLIFPFIILKIQGIPITFTMYVQVLKDIARYHFIGKTISSIQKLSWDKLIYLIITIGLYGLQIYQNITACYRFYRNTSMINVHLLELRDFLKYSMRSTDIFLELNRPLQTYTDFNETTMKHRTNIGKLYELLKPIKPFQPGFSKIAEIGYLLRCFYEIHTNEDFGLAIRYSIGFEGYINNLTGIHENIIAQKISMAKFSQESNTQMQQLYYPPYGGGEATPCVKNCCDLSNNIIITGPNASGKTTMLKSVTINLIFTQQFGCGFYGSCTLSPYTHIHSYLNIPDTSGRDSLFQAESRRCKEIINIINEPWENETERNARHFCIFDELYSGTNPKEASKSAYAFLLYLSKYTNVDFILTTHYVKLCKKLEKKLGSSSETKHKKRPIANYKMACVSSNDGRVKYSYKMKKGISKIEGAILILEDMQYPKEIIDEVRNCKNGDRRPKL
jgi:hypothetical protein